MGLFDDINGIVQDIVGNFDDVSRWQTGWLSDAGDTGTPAFANRPLQVTAVNLDASGMEVTAVDGTNTYVLKADDTTAASLNGTPVPHANVVFQPKPSFAHPERVAFDFRPIPLVDGNQGRFNLRYDPS